MKENIQLLSLASEIGAIKCCENRVHEFDILKLYLDPDVSSLIGSIFIPMLYRAGVDWVCGAGYKAMPLVSIIALKSKLGMGKRLPGLLVRDRTRLFSRYSRYVERNLKRGALVAVVDDCCDKGKSLFHSIKILEKLGCEVVLIAVILDRKEGGSEKIKKKGYNFVSLLEATPEGDIVPSV